MNVTCPVCKKEVPWNDNPYRPFCSERCRLIDLGEWASGQRGIPGDHDPTSEEDSSKDPVKSSSESSED